jgi:hypothetical protein
MHTRLPGWTDADIYLALSRIWLGLDEQGLPAGPEDAAAVLLADPKAAAPTSVRLRGRGQRESLGSRAI